MLDGHFIMEHAGRNWSGRFFNFNGTAGIWRRVGDRRRGRLAARHADRGHGPLVPRAAARLEVRLPARDRGARRAARRDVGVQVAAVPLGQGLGAGGEEAAARRSCARTRPWQQKSEAFFHLTNNLAYPLLLVLSILLLPNLALRTHHGWREVLMIDLPLFFGTTLSIASFYMASQREIALLRDPDAKPRFQWRVLARLPLVMSIGIGLCVNQTRAVLEALVGQARPSSCARPSTASARRVESWSEQEVPRRQVDHAVHRAGDGGLLRRRDRASPSTTGTTCRCRSWACSCAASATSAGCRCGRAASGVAMRRAFAA